MGAVLAEEKPGEGLGGEHSSFRDQTEGPRPVFWEGDQGRERRLGPLAPGAQRFQVPYLVP